LTRKAIERDAVFQPEFREDLRYWVDNDRRVALRVIDLVDAVLHDPFRGIGKPEPLRHFAPNKHMVAPYHSGAPPRLSRPTGTN
jgi:YoeB-like toxin of bacterial type II toxin-antitoxin system